MQDNKRITREEWKILFDKTTQDYYTREEKIAALKANIAVRQKVRSYLNQGGYVLINNGEIEKRIDADLPIPEGWKRGRVPRKRVQV
jgi:hypothetical protein